MSENNGKQFRSVVLGAGIQGVLIALMLANRGEEVVIIDRRSSILSGASLNYEGRIHTGLIYAMDKSFRTAERMIQDSLHFSKAIERYTGCNVNWSAMRSTPSKYLVHKESSLSVEELDAHFTKVEQRFLEVADNSKLDYLGIEPQYVSRACAIPDCVSRDSIIAAFDTLEACVDQGSMNRLLNAAVSSHPNIALQLDSEIIDIAEGTENRWTVSCQDASKQKLKISGSKVFNCLWEARGLFDKLVGINTDRNETMRLKYGVVLQSNETLETAKTVVVVHGAFGTIVHHDYSPHVFMSWYPACIKGILPLQKLPEDWLTAMEGPADDETLELIGKSNIEGFQSILPSIGNPLPIWAKPGVIVAEGMRDIDDDESDFHRRDEPAIARKGSYYSISTSKYTSAPRNTLLLEKELFPD